MKKLLRLLVVALIAGGIATIIVQRERIKQLDRQQLMSQIRETVDSVLNRGDGAEASVDPVAEEPVEEAEELAEANDETPETADETPEVAGD